MSDHQPSFRDYEVEATLMVTAPSHEEAQAAVARSGFAPGALIGEALVEQVTVFGEADDE